MSDKAELREFTSD